MATGVKCPFCGHAAWSKGKVPSVATRGKKERYYCPECGRSGYWGVAEKKPQKSSGKRKAKS